MLDAVGIDHLALHDSAEDLYFEALVFDGCGQGFDHAGDVVIGDDVCGGTVDDFVDVLDSDLVGGDFDEVVFGDEDSAAAVGDLAR